MTRKMVTWVSVVSGLLTIIWAFGNPFIPKPELNVYVISSEYIISPKEEGNDKSYLSPDYTTKIEVTNVGDKVATRVHIDFKKGYKNAIIINGKQKSYHKESAPIYIEDIEPSQSVVVYFWSFFPNISTYSLDDNVVVSSPNSGISKLRTDINGDGFIWYLEQYWIFILTFTFIVFFLTLQSLAIKQDKKNNAETKFTGDPINDSVKYHQIELLNHACDIGLISESEYQDRTTEILETFIKKNKA